MFEKIAEERCSIIDALTEKVIRDVDSVESYKLGKLDGFKDGATFGYNKAIEKLKCCGNCKKYQFNTFHQQLECISNTCEWEMKETL